MDIDYSQIVLYGGSLAAVGAGAAVWIIGSRLASASVRESYGELREAIGEMGSAIREFKDATNKFSNNLENHVGRNE